MVLIIYTHTHTHRDRDIISWNLLLERECVNQRGVGIDSREEKKLNLREVNNKLNKLKIFK